jgi:GGDEF domain-containing protein
MSDLPNGSPLSLTEVVLRLSAEQIAERKRRHDQRAAGHAASREDGLIDYQRLDGSVGQFNYEKALLVLVRDADRSGVMFLIRTDDDRWVALRNASDDRWAIELSPEDALVLCQSGPTFVIGRRDPNTQEEFAIDCQLPPFADHERLPDPSELTVGRLARFVQAIERLDRVAAMPRDAWDGKSVWDDVDRRTRRELVMASAPGFSEFKTYLNAELGMPVIPEALEEVERRLARRLRKSFEDVGRLSLVEAVAILNRPEAPTAPSPAARPTNESERQPEAPAHALLRSAVQAKSSGDQTPPPAPGIDYGAIYTTLLNKDMTKPAQLVKFIGSKAGKTSATDQKVLVSANHKEILDGVYEGSEKEWSTIKSLVNRTNNALFDLDEPVKAMAQRLKFKTADFSVIMEIKPE